MALKLQDVFSLRISHCMYLSLSPGLLFLFRPSSLLFSARFFGNRVSHSSKNAGKIGGGRKIAEERLELRRLEVSKPLAKAARKGRDEKSEGRERGKRRRQCSGKEGGRSPEPWRGRERASKVSFGTLSPLGRRLRSPRLPPKDRHYDGKWHRRGLDAVVCPSPGDHALQIAIKPISE